MKKIRIKNLRKKQPDQAPGRITNETVAEHREQILAGGRRFKYPIQYAKHKLVINAVVVTLSAIIILAVFGWWQLYVAQNSSGFMYRLTQLIPVPVAVIDGQQVRFSDYLVQYRGSEFYLSKYDELKIDSKDGKEQLQYVKRESLDKAITDAYASKIAKEKGIRVSNSDVSAIIDDQLNTANGRISQQTYDTSSRMMYDWTPQDYRSAVSRSILRARVAFAIDENAKKKTDKAAELLKTANGDFAAVAAQLQDNSSEKVVASDSTLVNLVGSYFGLQVSDLAKLNVGDMTGPVTTTSDAGYYFVKIVDKTDTKIRFTYLFIPLTELDRRVSKLKESGKVSEYIKVSVAKAEDSNPQP